MNRRATVMKWAMKAWTLRMGIAWAEFWTGLVGLLTLGIASPLWTFRAMSRFHEFCVSNPYPED
jgi:hypothetical protein